jgi:hypothetical protein
MKLHTEGSFFTAAVFALCASFILLTSGCIKVNLDITVDRDGSGTYGGEFATSKVFIETFNEETDGLSLAFRQVRKLNFSRMKIGVDIISQHRFQTLE